MDINKVRIGNDICLKVNISGLNDFDHYNIKQIKAYIINVSKQDATPVCADACRCTCGPRGYHFYPYRIPYYHHPYIPTNPAFGLAPIPHCYSCCGWGHPHHCMNRFHCDHSCFIPDCQMDRYLAPSKITQEDNKVEVYFPAKDQLECGIYKLVLVISTYENGWGKQNIHTYTIDYGVVFELDSESGESGYIIYDVEKQEIVNPGDDSTPGGSTNIGYATTNKYGIVQLATNADDADDNDVVTVNILRNTSCASVEDTTLVFGKNGNSDSGNPSGDAQDAL